jgi:N-acetylglucosaminyldiphosphoundecaprenol N-acetyl-beta-D-mannosaminyltransferase
LNAVSPGSKGPKHGWLETSLVGTLPINQLRMDEAAEALLSHVRQVRRDHSIGRAIHIFGVNAQVATLVRDNDAFAAAISSADVLYADGISVVLASQLLGRPLRGRIPGGELMELLCKQGAKEGLSVYFLGGLPDAAEKTAEILKARYPGLKIAGACCPPFNFETNPEESASVVRSIQEAAPDMLFVGLGVPKQEIWIAENSAVLPVGLAFPVGAAFDTTAGFRKRAPVWARRTGSEWLYRLAMEPRRLWRRYLVGNTAFAIMILTQWIRERGQRPLAAGD